MMKSSCVVLLFALTSVSAVQRSLDSIDDLKQINSGQSVPTHTLLLLHWFANMVDIDGNVVRLTFDPNSDYGSHYYGNYEGMLELLPWGSEYRYYTVGNLNQETTSRQLPSYVTSPPRGYVSNRDRIVFRVRGQVIDQVYITQHQGQIYDPDQTYLITTNLLRQIREFSLGQNQQQLLQLRNRFGSNANLPHIRNVWGDLAVLGLLLFIVIQDKCSFQFSFQEQCYRPENYDRPGNYDRPENCDRPENYNRPENYDRPENYNRPGNYNRPENRQNPWDGGQDSNAPIICIILFICIVGFIIIMLGKGDPRYRY